MAQETVRSAYAGSTTGGTLAEDVERDAWRVRASWWVSIAIGLSVLGVAAVAVVQALGGPEVVPSSAFRSKAALLYSLVAGASAVVMMRSRHEGIDYFLPAEMYEDAEILSDEDGQALRTVRQASWAHRAGRASTYSSISLGLIIVVALLFVANEDAVAGKDVEALFVWVILIASLSVVLYGISLQLWDEALGSGYPRNRAVELRRSALILSSLGWLTLSTALGLAVITVHSPLGAVVGLAGVVAALYVFEHKWRLAHVDHCHELEAHGVVPFLRRLSTGKPNMRVRSRHLRRSEGAVPR